MARVAGQMVRDALVKITAAARTNGTDPLDELPVARAHAQEARERLERALCSVLERRYPGRRFAMKDQLDTLSHRATAASTTTANTHSLKDAA